MTTNLFNSLKAEYTTNYDAFMTKLQAESKDLMDKIIEDVKLRVQAMDKYSVTAYPETFKAAHKDVITAYFKNEGFTVISTRTSIKLSGWADKEKPVKDKVAA